MSHRLTKEEEQLFELCYRGTAPIREFTALLSRQVRLNIHDQEGQHPLWLVSYHGRSDLADLFLRHGAAVDLASTDKLGDTALMIASAYGHLETAKLLLHRGALVNFRRKNGTTALCQASQKDHIKVVRLLLESGALVNKVSISPIHCASLGGSLRAAQVLLDHGADVNQPTDDKLGDTALITASAHGHLETAKLLLHRGALVNFRRKDGLTALYFASKNNHVEVVKFLLNSEAQVNKGTISPLYIASLNGRLEITQVLLDHGADVNQPTDEEPHNSPLQIACKNNHLQVAQLLIINGADVDYEDSNGGTPLHHAAGRGHIELVKLLLLSHAKLNIKDNYLGYTPLHWAVNSGEIEVVRLLLLSQANMEIKNNAGKTPLQVAEEEKHMEIVHLLKTGVPAQPAEVSVSDEAGAEAGDGEGGQPSVEPLNGERKTMDDHSQLAVPSGHILTKDELQVLRALLASYSCDKLKSFQLSLEEEQEIRDIPLEEVETSLRQSGLDTMADRLRNDLEKGILNEMMTDNSSILHTSLQ